MVEILKASRDTFVAQGNSAALSAGLDPNEPAYTGDTPATIDNRHLETATGSVTKGADYLNLELEVTAAHATNNAVTEVWYQEAEDPLKWSKWKYSHTIPDSIIAAVVDHYDAAAFELNARYTKLAVVSDNAINANLIATPKYYATV